MNLSSVLICAKTCWQVWNFLSDSRRFSLSHNYCGCNRLAVASRVVISSLSDFERNKWNGREGGEKIKCCWACDSRFLRPAPSSPSFKLGKLKFKKNVLPCPRTPSFDDRIRQLTLVTLSISVAFILSELFYFKSVPPLEVAPGVHIALQGTWIDKFFISSSL